MRRTCCRQHRAGVEVHDRGIMGVGIFRGRLAPQHAAGIVDEPVEMTEGLRRLLDDTLGLAFPRHVALDQVHGAAGRPDLVCKLLRRFAAGIVMHADLGPLSRKGAGQRRADPGRGAGDQHGLAGQVRQLDGCERLRKFDHGDDCLPNNQGHR